MNNNPAIIEQRPQTLTRAAASDLSARLLQAYNRGQQTAIDAAAHLKFIATAVDIAYREVLPAAIDDVDEDQHTPAGITASVRTGAALWSFDDPTLDQLEEQAREAAAAVRKRKKFLQGLAEGDHDSLVDPETGETVKPAELTGYRSRVLTLKLDKV
jgi:hypothetical protein